MPRKLKRMNALELRKQLLIAESELNRIQLAAKKAALHSGVHTITQDVSTVGAIAASTAMLVSNLAAIPRKQHTVGRKALWLQTFLYGSVLVSSVWLALIPRKTRTSPA